MSKRYPSIFLLPLTLLLAGCGTMRTSDTTRTATEQLLLSHSIDDSVSQLDFRMLSGRRVFLETQYLDGVTDKGYLISSLRQQLLACGCLLQEDRKTATYIVEARSGSVGTDRNDMLIGVPQMSIPSVMPGIPGAMIPEVALAKKTNRRAVAKVAVFAYHRDTGEAVWQSGTVEATSRERNSWLCGAGPFKRGSLHRGTEFDDQRVVVPLLDRKPGESKYPVVSVEQPVRWKRGPLPEDEAIQTAKESSDSAKDGKVIQASTTPPASSDANKSE
jgi:hypothetical protein